MKRYPIKALFFSSLLFVSLPILAENHEMGKMDHQQGGMSGMQGMMGKMEHSFAHMVMMHADDLALTDEQLGKIARIHLKHKAEHTKIKERLHKSMMSFHEESMKPDGDAEKMRGLGKEHTAAFEEMINQHITERDELNAVLSPDQQTKLKSLKMDHGGMMGMMKKMHGEKGEGQPMSH